MQSIGTIESKLNLKGPLSAEADPFEFYPEQNSNFKNLNITNKIDFFISRIDCYLTSLLNKILHHPDFQRIEATWRSLHYLCECPSGAAPVKIKILNIKMKELADSFNRATEVEDSMIFNLVYNEEFGMPGGEPFGVLLCDYYIRHHPTKTNPVDDVELLAAMSTVGAAAFVPVIFAASPEFFGVSRFIEMERIRKLQRFTGQAEYDRFNRLTRNEDSRFLGITLPRVLVRTPYLTNNALNLPFNYREDNDGLTHEDLCWGSSIYPFGEVLIRAFEQYGWFANITGILQGEITCGVVRGITNFSVETDPNNVIPRPSIEIVITGQLEDELRDSGFISLTVCKDTTLLAFRSVPSIQVPQRFDKKIGNVNARIATNLDNIFCVSRFAHYVKVQMRDKIGSFQSPYEIEKKISEWLSRYATANDNASLEIKAKYPLREFGIEIRELSGRPSEYTCKLFLRPHFKLDNMNISFSLHMKVNNEKNSR